MELKEVISKALELKQALNEEEAAEYIGMSRSFLRQSRVYGNRAGRTRAPPFTRLGPRTIRYLRSDLDEWLESGRVAISDITGTLK